MGKDTNMEQSINKMGTKPVFPLLMSMAIPPMISMMIQSMYNIVDSIFVAKIGQDAITAVSLAFPLQNIILAAAVGLGIGLNSCIARNLGAKDKEAAGQTGAHGLLLTGFHALLFVFVGVLFIKPFFQIFTDNAQIYQWGCEYTYIVVLFSFGSLFHIAIEKMFQATGKMIFPMILQGIGAIVNIILDPIMIFGKFGVPAMGVKGAAVATIIGQMTACLLAVIFFIVKEKDIKIHWHGFRFKWSIVKSIYSVAIPSTIMMSLPSILVAALNGILINISSTAIAVFGIYFKLQTFIYMPSNGLIQGMRPIISYNYGAGNRERIVQTIKLALGVTAVIMAFGTALFILLPKQILGMFSATDEMMGIGVMALRIISTCFVISAIPITVAAVFESIGKGFDSLIISLLRQLIIIPPLALVFSRYFGLSGVWITFPIAETAAAAVSILLLIKIGKRDPILSGDISSCSRN